MLNVFSVDVEDYFQVSGFERHISRDDWHQYECRVVPNTQRLLELLDQKRVRATFFVLGWVAERFPGLVRAIHDAGHELGSHGYWHELVYTLTPDKFRDDVNRSKAAIEDAAGVRVDCYRAPSFSITKKSLWALDILVQEGFTCDSSIFPVKRDRYGMDDCPLGIHVIQTPSGPITEFPMTSIRYGRVALPVGGGGYFRLYPYAVTHRLLRTVNARHCRPAMFYIHPWEIDPLQPRLRAGGRLSQWRHYVNLDRTTEKLARLLDSLKFGSLREVLANSAQAGVVV
jgi:polysaccharide deacetylase family protein (PEP-CTERM system associated)